jgi:hypothetical protein
MDQPRVATFREGLPEAFLSEIMQMVNAGAPEEELVSYMQQRAPEAYGMDMDEEDARRQLAPIIVIVDMVKDAGDRFREQAASQAAPQTAPRQEEERSLREILGFAVSGIKLALRMKAITTCPHLVGRLVGDYESLEDGEKYSFLEVLTELFIDEELASYVVNSIEHIRAERDLDPDYLLPNDEMEFLRKLLFLIKAAGIKDKYFCDFGKGVLNDLRAFVGDYEEKMAQ